MNQRPALAALAAALLAPDANAAERVLDQLSTAPGSVVVQFSCPMSYVSNYPLRSGDEIRIELQPLPGCPPSSGSGETLPVPGDNAAGLVDLRLDQALGSRRALTLHFARNVEFLVRPLRGFTGIEISFARRAGRSTVEDANPPPRPSRAPSRSLPPAAELERITAEARIAMQERDYDAAIRLYTKLLEFPEHPARPQAQEYVGLARERKGQLAQAKLEYQEYLRRYPDGAGADAVRQRLAALVTLEGASRPTRDAPDGSRWQVSGAVAQDYRRDQNTVTTAGASANGIGQSAVDSEADLQLVRRGDAYDFRARVFAGYLHDLGVVPGSSASQLRLPQAYVEVDDTRSHWAGRVGRQSQTAGGVFGSYDGAYFDWLVRPQLKISFAAGAPLETYTASFQHARQFASMGVELLGVRPGLDLTAFASQQNASGILDSREVGAEARYYANGHSLVGQLVYDASYHALDAATILASWALPGRWMLTGIGDHRRSPFLGTYNALIGQPTTSLDALVNTLGSEAVRALARARSGTSDTFTLGLQRPIGERLQWGSDVTMSRYEGTVASGGVAATPGSGTALSISSQLLGGGWLVDSDMNTVGVSYSTRAGTRAASLYGSARYPLGPALRIGPRLQLSYTRGSDPATGTSAGWSASPSLLADWRFGRGLVQFEAGYARAALDASLAPGIPVGPMPPPATLQSQQTQRFWFGAGYNVNF